MGSPLHPADFGLASLRANASPSLAQALSSIAETFPHPQRTLMSSFVQEAADKVAASQYYLVQFSAHSASTILANWISLLEQLRPVACSEDPMLRRPRQADGARCCLSGAQNGKGLKEQLLFAYILSPTFWSKINLGETQPLREMLAAFIGDTQLQKICSLFSETDVFSRSSQVLMLSPQMFESFRNGRHSLDYCFSTNSKDQARYAVRTNSFLPGNHPEVHPIANITNQDSDVVVLPNSELLQIHAQLAKPLAWLEVSEYMTSKAEQPNKRALHSVGLFSPLAWLPGQIATFSRNLFQRLWLCAPGSFRASAYRWLVSLAPRLYGPTGSDRTHRLPFNLFLRVAGADWAPRHQAEMRTLQLVQEHTQIPAPRGIDFLQHGASSFLLMSGCPGKGIGLMLPTMTDDQVQLVREDLKAYVQQLRQIPNRTDSGYQICNSLADGILDWRIGDSQREKLRFIDEYGFNKYLTYDLPLNEEHLQTIAKAHNVSHKIVFTHADLNLRNILVNEKCRISGIVDWECAGWYPEYWEHSKAYFTARSVTRWLADVIDQVFPNYHKEQEAESLLQSMSPPW